MTAPAVRDSAPPEFREFRKNYRIIAKLGEGGMAVVHLAVVRGVGDVRKLVVLKSMRPELVADSRIREMFLEESRLAATLNHPNIVQTYEVVVLAGRPVLVMEYMNGLSLGRILGGAKPAAMPLALHLWILNEVLSGLEYVHNATDLDGSPRSLVHRDISPQNVFVTYDGHVKILDFGIAKNTGSIGHTETGLIKGKVRYMAPEQLIGSAELDRRADIFSVGVMLWEALTGQRLWEGISEVEVMHRLIQGHTPLPGSVRLDVAPALEAICRKALSPNGDDRYASAAQMQNALESAVLELSLGANSRQLGNFVSELFEDRRLRTKQIVEQQMKDENASPITLVMSDESELPTQEQATIGADVFRPLAGSPSGAFGSKPRPGRRGFIAAVALAGGGALLALAFALFYRRDAGDGPAASSSGNAVKAATRTEVGPASSPSGKSKSVRVSIAASPPRSQLFLDEVPLAGNPFSGEVPSDSERHFVRAEAKGFRPQTFLASLATALDMKIELEAVPATASPARPSFAKAPLAPVASASGETPPAGSLCSPPFFFDEQGFKHIKPECLK
jgi:serine/threonine-protein kinase